MEYGEVIDQQKVFEPQPMESVPVTMAENIAPTAQLIPNYSTTPQTYVPCQQFWTGTGYEWYGNTAVVGPSTPAYMHASEPVQYPFYPVETSNTYAMEEWRGDGVYRDMNVYVAKPDEQVSFVTPLDVMQPQM